MADTQTPSSEPAPSDLLLNQWKQERDQQLRSTLTEAAKYNPDVAADAATLARKTGLPVDTVERNIDAVRANVLARQVAETTSPVLRRQLMDPNFAKLAHDDVDNMSAVEQLLRNPVVRSARGLAAGIPKLSGGLYGVVAGGFGLLRGAAEPVSGGNSAFPLLPVNPFAEPEEFFRNAARGQDQVADRWAGDRGDSVVAQGIYSGFESLGQNLPLMAAAVVSGNPALALGAMSATVGGQEYVKARDAGVDPLQSVAYGTTQGMIEALTEKIPVSQLFADTAKGAGFFRTLFNQAVSEIPGEQAATILQDLNEWAVLNPDKPFSAYVAERPDAAVQTLAATLVGVAGMTTVTTAVDYAVNRGQQRAFDARMAELNAQRLEMVGKVMEASKVLQRSPEGMQAFLQAAGANDPEQDLYFDAETLMQSPVGAQLAAAVPAVAQQLPTALANNGTVRISMADYAQLVAPTEMNAVLADMARVGDPTAFSRAEAQEFMQTAIQQVEQEAAKVLDLKENDVAFRESHQRVKQAVLARLNELNAFPPHVNEFYAAQQAAYAAARASRTGQTPEEFFTEHLLSLASDRTLSTQGDVYSQYTPSVQVGDRDVPVTLNVHDKRSGFQLVPVTVAAFDQGFKADDGYIGPGGTGAAIGDRYPRFAEFAATAASIEAPTVSVRESGTVVFGNGRHRFAYLRDQGARVMYVAMDSQSLANAQRAGMVASPEQLNQTRREAAVAGWTKNRVARLLDTYAIGHQPDVTQAYAVMMSPQQFIGLTAHPLDEERINEETGPLNEAELARQIQEIYLNVEPQADGTMQVVGHEGRHRMTALARAGVTQVPVVVNLHSWNRGEYQRLESATLLPQRGAPRSATVNGLEPITYNNKKALLNMGGQDVLFQSAVDNLIMVAERGERQRGARALLSQAEKTAVAEAAAAFGLPVQEVYERVRDTKLAHPTKQGWAPLVFTGLKADEDTGKLEYIYKTIPYGFSTGPNKKALEKSTKPYDKRVNAIAKKMAEEVRSILQRARAGDKNAQNILAQAGWYKAMRTRLRKEFGGLGDLFADLLGATSPNTPVRDNWFNAVDSLRRAMRGDFDELMPKWVSWVETVEKQEMMLRSYFDDMLDNGMTKKAIKESAEYIWRKEQLRVARKLPPELMPSKENDKNYGFNGRNVVRAMVDLWRVVKNADADIGRGGTKPKALNFSGNLIGFRERATIDVWAARMLQRLAGLSRIPSVAEGGVTGEMKSTGETTLQFGFGQDVFTAAVKLIRGDSEMSSEKALAEINDDDLQAVVWFIEKELWTLNDWTNAAGEGGSFELEANLTGTSQQERVRELRRIIDASPPKADVTEAANLEVAVAALNKWADKHDAELKREIELEAKLREELPRDQKAATNKELEALKKTLADRKQLNKNVEKAERARAALEAFDQQKVAARAQLMALEREVDRYVGGLSIQMSSYTQGVDYVPTDAAMARLSEAVRLAIYEDDNGALVLGSKALSTEGRYGGIERSLDLEFIVREGYNPDNVWLAVLRAAQQARQDSTFLARVLRDKEEPDLLVHRPGIELYFRETADRAKLEQMLAELADPTGAIRPWQARKDAYLEGEAAKWDAQNPDKIKDAQGNEHEERKAFLEQQGNDWEQQNPSPVTQWAAKRDAQPEELRDQWVKDNPSPEGAAFLTVIVDGRRTPEAVAGAVPNAVGVRILYIPEFEQRYGMDNLADLSDLAIADKVEAKSKELVRMAEFLMKTVDGVSFGGQFWYETDVAFSHQYQEKIDALTTRVAEEDAGGVGSRVWAGQSVRAGVESANRQTREASSGQPDGQPGALPAGDAESKQELLKQSAQEARPYFSALTRAIRNLAQNSATPEQWAGIIHSPERVARKALRDPATNKPTGQFEEYTIPASSPLSGVKLEEVEWSGVLDWLKEQEGPVSKEDLLAYLMANELEIKEVHHDDKYKSYTLPGGVKYNALLLVLPEYAGMHLRIRELENKKRAFKKAHYAEYSADNNGLTASERAELKAMREIVITSMATQFRNNHFTTENVVAFTRFDARIGADGRRILHVAEIQSDWHQQGRKKGYRGTGGEALLEAGRLSALEAPRQELLRKIRSLVSIIENAGYIIIEDKLHYDTDHKDYYDILNRLPEEERAQYTDADGVDLDGPIEVREGDVVPLHIEQAVKRLRDLDAELDAMGPAPKPFDTSPEFRELQNSALKNMRDGGVPNAPFKTTWPELILKRLVRWAAENGYDEVTWDTGDTQNKRFSLTTVVRKVVYLPVQNEIDNGVLHVQFKDPNKADMTFSIEREDQLAEYLGEELAKKLIESPPINEFGYRKLEGEGLEMGGEGQRGFYDDILPKTAKKLFGKYGATITKATTPSAKPLGFAASQYRNGSGWGTGMEYYIYATDDRGLADWGNPPVAGPLNGTDAQALLDQLNKAYRESNPSTPAWSMRLTPELREAALAGFPMFQEDRGSFNPRTNLITLLEAADLSTFLHESAHYYFETDLRVARKLLMKNTHTEGETQILDDVSKVLKWHGIEGSIAEQMQTWDNLSFDMKRVAHERFAEAYERYLFEGKAPSLELESAFRAFTAWLKRVYNSLRDFLMRNPGANDLNDEIRKVFDRMLATEEQIRVAEATRELLPLFGTAEEMKKAGIDPRTYTELQMAATQKGLEYLQAKGLRDLRWLTNAKSKELKRLRKEMEGNRKRVREEVRKDVESRPIYQAVRWLTKGVLVRDGEEVKAEKGYKLDRAMVEEMYPESALARPDLGKLKRMMGPQGQDPQVIAELFGYNSADALIRALVEATPMEQEVDALTDQRMLEEYGELTTQQGLEREADKAVHNELRGRMLVTESNALDMAVGKPRLLEAAARLAADRLIGSLVVGKLRPRQYLSAEAKSGKQAAAAFKAGDLKEAALAKRRQLFNFYAARSAYEAQDEMRNILRNLRRLAAMPDKRAGTGRNMDVVNAVRAVLAQRGYGQQTKSAGDYLKLVRDYDPQAYDALIQMSENALAIAPGKKTDEMTVEELREFNAEVTNMWRLAKREQEVTVDGKLRSRQSVVTELLDRLNQLGGGNLAALGTSSAPTEAEQRMLTFASAKAWLRRVEHWVEGIDGMGVGVGVFRRYIFLPIKEAADRYRADRITYLKRFTESFDAVAPTLKRGLLDARELGYTFGKDEGGVGMNELLHAILHTGNESNKRKLLLGRGWGKLEKDGTLDTSRWDAFVQRMVDEGVLTRAHFDFAQKVWDLLEELKPAAQKAHRDAYGKYFSEVTAGAFNITFPDGSTATYRGGYVPAMTDSRIVKDAALKRLIEEGKDTMMHSFPGAAKGFTMSRVEYNRPLLLDLRTLRQHIDKVLLFSHLEVPVRDIGKLLRDGPLADALNKVDPAALDTMLLPWLNTSARQQVTVPVPGAGWLSAFINTLRNRTALATMFANLSNAIQQTSGLVTVLPKLNRPAHLASAMAHWVKGPRELADSVAANSTFMANRMSNEVSAMLGDMDKILLDPSLYERSQDWFRQHAYFLQSAVDNVLGPVVWTAAYNDALEQGNSHEDSVRLADSAVRTTQGSTLPEDVAAFEVQNAFVRTFLQFTGFFNNWANMLGTEYAKIMRAGGLRMHMGRGVFVFLTGFYAAALVAELIAQAFRGGPPDEDRDGSYLDDWLMALFVYGPMRSMTAMVPLAGQAVNAAVSRFNDNPTDDRVASAPAVTLLEATVAVPSDLYKEAIGRGNNAKTVRDVATLITLTTGLPANTLARPIAYLAGVEQGKVQPTGPVDAARGLVTGTASPESKGQ